MEMEWRRYYIDLVLVPLGLVIIFVYHLWLWHKVRTQPFTTVFGIDADGRRLWVPSMMKDLEKKGILVVQGLRNLIMGSTLMATTSILICAALGAIISSTCSVKKPITDSIFGAHGELVVALKYAILLSLFLFSFLCHTISIMFLNQVNILIFTPQDVMSLVTSTYLSDLMEKATILSTVGNRLFYAGLSLVLWIFGPLLAFASSVAMVPMLYNLDFIVGNENTNLKDVTNKIAFMA